MPGKPMIYLFRKMLHQPERVLRSFAVRIRTATSWGRLYDSLPEPKRVGPVIVDNAVAADVRAALEAAGLVVERRSVEPEHYRAWLMQADYSRYPLYLDGGRAPGFTEKGLEHFVAAGLLGLRAGQVCIDVASQNSPAPDIYEWLYGAVMYTLDLAYRPGVHGRRIGGSASELPLPDDFVDAMVLHNAFEHFEGDADTAFIREAARVLKPGGRLCILPLFLFTEYAIQTDPAALTGTLPPFDAGARLWAARGWRDRHGRFYDAAHLKSRLLDHAGAFDVQLIEFTDAAAVDASCYLRFAVVFTRR
jgi:SAM-dependent methyltransferase